MSTDRNATSEKIGQIGQLVNKAETVSGKAYTWVEDKIDDLFPSWTARGAFFDKHLFSFSAPQVVSIRDPVLGTIMAILKALVLTYVCVEIFYNRKYNYEEMPRGYPSHITFERGTFNTERKVWSKANGGYCASSKIKNYEYLSVIRDNADNIVSPIMVGGKYVRAADPIGNSAQNDDKVSCQQFHFAEITKVTSQAAYLMTFQKETYSTVLPASSTLTDCTVAPVRKGSDAQTTVIVPKTDNALLAGRNYFETEEYKNGGGTIIESKTCLEMKNTIAVAPEFVDLSFDHTYVTSDRVMYERGATGSSATPKSKGNRHPHTFVRTSPDHPSHPNQYVDVKKLTQRPVFAVEYLGKERDDRAKISAGEKVTIPVAALLRLAGISLEDASNENVAPLRKGQSPPPRRITGVTLDLELKYSVRTFGVYYPAGQAEADCDLIVQHVDGFVAWTADPQMHSPAVFSDPENTREYSEIVRRGIQIRFRATGKVLEFDLYQLVNVLIQALVLLPYVGMFVLLIATSLVPKKDIYKNKMTEPVNFNREVTKFAGSVLQYSDLFRRLQAKAGVTGPELSEDDLTKIFKPSVGGNADKSRKLAKQMLFAEMEDPKTKLVKEITRRSLTEDQFVDLLANAPCTVAQMNLYLSAEAKSAISQERLLDRIEKQKSNEEHYRAAKKEREDAKEAKERLAAGPVALTDVEKQLNGNIA